MFIRVLGSAAGGAFPQWNCGCANCMGVRRGSIRATPRSQESVAISAEGKDWFLLNASPEIARQIESFDRLHPRSERDSPICGILLTNGDLDHCLGLLSLRESQPLQVYATERVWRGFSRENRMYRTLERFEGQLTFRALRFGEEQPLVVTGSEASGLSVRALAVPGKPALHLEELGADPEDNAGLLIREARTGKTLAYLPAVAAITAGVRAAVAEADAVFFDGTFWSSDELITLGVGTKRAEEMAHCPIAGAGGSLEFLRELPAARRVFIHINNTNPMLRDDSGERQLVEAAGVQVAYDGLELTL